MLATPNEPALRDAGARTIGSIAKEALESMSQFGDGDMLTMPQETYLFEAGAI